MPTNLRSAIPIHRIGQLAKSFTNSICRRSRDRKISRDDRQDKNREEKRKKKNHETKMCVCGWIMEFRRGRDCIESPLLSKTEDCLDADAFAIHSYQTQTN